MNWAKWAYSSWTVSGNLIQSPMSSNCNLICSLHSNSTKLSNLELDKFFLSKKDLEKHFPDVHEVSTRVDKLFIFKVCPILIQCLFLKWSVSWILFNMTTNLASQLREDLVIRISKWSQYVPYQIFVGIIFIITSLTS